MRRLLVVVACVAATGATACASDNGNGAALTTKPASTASTVPLAESQAKADRLTDLMIAEKWNEVVVSFNSEMRASLSADGLKTAWGQVVATYGAYKSRGATVQSQTAATPGLVVFDTPMTFGAEALKSRITFDGDGKVAGLFILKASVP
jgi:hypothetical protein